MFIAFLLLFITGVVSLRTPIANRRLSINNRSSARASSQEEGKNVWSGIRNLISGSNKSENNNLPAWKLLESFEELDTDVEAESSQKEPQEAPPMKASLEYFDGVNLELLGLDSHSLDGAVSDNNASQKGFLLRTRKGRSGKAGDKKKLNQCAKACVAVEQEESANTLE